MAASKIRDDNFYQISGWMINRLNLKGAALQIYAIIYGFSQDGESSFTGSLQYLCDFTNTTKHTVIKALRELTEKGYVLKTENFINGVQFNTYKINALVVQKMHWGSAETIPGGSAKTAPGGSAETAPNNKGFDNKSLNNKGDKKGRTPAGQKYGEYQNVILSDEELEKLKALFPDDWQDRIDRLSAYIAQSGKRYQSHFATIRNWARKDAEERPQKYGRKEPVPKWMGKRELDEDEVAAVKRMMNDSTIGNDPALAERANKLREQLQGA